LQAARFGFHVLVCALAVCGTAWAQPAITVGPDLGTFSVGEIQFPLTASGGNGTYAWSVASGLLPAGVLLRTDVPSGFNGASAGLIGVATTPGLYNFRLSVTSGGQNAHQDCTMNITALTLKDQYNLPDAFVGDGYSYTLMALGGAATVSFSVPANQLPPNMTLSATGLLSGAPTAAGPYNMNVTFTDGTSTVSRNVQLNVSAVHVTSPALLPNTTQNSFYSYTLSASGGTGSITWSGGGLPNGLTLNSASGTISGTVSTGPGRYIFGLTATDANHSPYTKNMAIVVLNVPAGLPSLAAFGASGMFDDCTIGVPCQQQIQAQNGTPPFHWTVTGLPQWMGYRSGEGITSSDVWPDDLELWGTPQATGTYSFTAVATDANSVSVTQTFALRVSGLMVDGSDHLQNGTLGAPYSQTLRVLGGSGTYTAQLVSIPEINVGLPGGLSLGAMAVSGAPAENGQFYPVLEFSDGSQTLQLTEGMYINNAGAGNINIGQSSNLGTLTVNLPYSNQLGACCAASITWSQAGGTLPPGIGLSPTGQLSGAATTLGVYTFLVEAADSSNPSNYGVRQFVLTVTPLNITPAGSLPYGNVGTVYNQTLVASGGTGQVTWALPPGSLLPPGLFLNSATGVISGTPSASGFYQFTIAVSDAANHVFVAGLNVSIYPAGSAPPLSITTGDQTWSIGRMEQPLDATGGAGVYTWSLASGTLPPGMSIRTDVPSGWNESAGLIGVATTPGPYTFTIRVTDSESHTASQSITVTVYSLVMTSNWELPDATLGQAYNTSMTAAGGSGNYTFALQPNNSLPPGLTLAGNGSITGTPTSAGVYPFNCTLSDGTWTTGCNGQITISAMAISTATLLPSATQNEAYNQAIAVTGGTPPYNFSNNCCTPGGIGMNNAGLLNGTSGGPGFWSFTVYVNDSAGNTARKTFQLAVLSTPLSLPSINTVLLDDFTIGMQSWDTVGVSGGTPPYNYAIASGALPPGVSLLGLAQVQPEMTASGPILGGAPTVLGTYQFTLQMTDSSVPPQTSSRTFDLRVSPLTWDGLPNGTLGVPYNQTLRMLGGQPPYHYTIVQGALPNGLSLNATTGLVAGTPAETGNFGFEPSITDSAAPPNGYMHGNGINISNGYSNNNVGIGPGSPLPYAIVNQGYNFYINAGGGSGTYNWTLDSGSLPAGLNLAPVSNSSYTVLSGTPTAIGMYTFILRATDTANSQNFAVRSFQLTVTPVILTGSANLPYGNVGTAYNATLTATGGTGTIAWAVAFGNALPLGLMLASNGAISGTPTIAGQYNFNATATDGGTGLANSWNFSLAIYPAGAAPPVGISNGPNFGTFPIGSQEFALTASGGNGTYTWSATGGSLPPGLALRTDIPSNWNQGQSAGIMGVATAPGNYNFTLKVTSGGQSSSQACTMRITGLTEKDSNLPDAFVGVSYPTYTLTALNAAGPVTWTINDGLPAGMSLSSSGVLSGVPTSPGNYNIGLTISDGVDAVGRGVRLNVYQVQITSPGMLPNATQNAAYNYTATASGGVSPYTFSSCCLPNGLSLDPASGLISGTVNGGPGKYGVWINGTDHNGAWYQKNMSLTVVGVPPLLPSMSLGGNQGIPDDWSIGANSSYEISANSGAAPFSWSVSGLPPGIGFRFGSGVTSSNVWPGDLELWGNPTATGVYQVHVTLNDATGATVTLTYPLRVSNLQTDWQTNLPNGTRGAAYSQTQRVLGGAGPYTAQIVGGTLPAGLALNGLTVSGTPQENGNFNVTYLFTDSVDSTLRYTEGFWIYSPTSPEIDINTGSNLGNVTVGQGWSNNLNGCCASSLAWSAAGGNWPPGITISSSGQLSGTPTTVGTYTFVVKAADAGNPSNYGLRQFVLTVTPIVITTSWTLPYGNVGTGYNQTLAATGGVGTLTWALVPGNYLPPGLTLNGNTINGTPTATGQYNFQISVTDSAGNTQAVQFNVSIYPGGAAPPVGISMGPDFGTSSIGEIQDGLTATGGNGTYSWSLTGGSLPPGLALRADLAPWFLNSNVSAEIGGLATTPGTYNFTLTVTSGGKSVSQACTMKITALRLKDQFTLPGAFMGVAYSYQMTALGAAGPVTFTAQANGLPPGVTLSSSGLLSGTPITAGWYGLNVTFTDGVDTVGRSININVSTIQITSPGMLPNATQNASYSYKLAASGGSGSYAWTSNCGINGLTLNASSGLISGTLNTGPGRYTCQYTATDTNLVSYSKNMSLTVIGTPPVLPSLSAASATGTFDDCTLGWPCSREINVNDGTPPFTWTVSGLPPGMDFRTGSGITSDNVWPDDVELWGTPIVSNTFTTSSGTFNITVTATDSTGVKVSQTFPLRVVALIVDGQDNLPNGTRGVAYARPGGTPPVVLRVLGGTGPYEANLMAGAFPAGLTLNGSAMTVSGTPLENGFFNTTLWHTDSAGNTLQISEGFSIGGGTSTINVNQNYDLGTVTVNTPYSNQLNACCVPSYTWSLPAGGTLPPGLGLSNSGQLSGTPYTVGVYTFLVQVADPTNLSNFGVRQFVLTVTPLSMSTNSLPYGNVGTFYSQTLTANGGAGTLTWTLPLGNYLPPGLSLPPGGVLSGTPTSSGFFSFAITVSDSAGHVFTNWFGLTIYPTGANPPLYLGINPNLGTYMLGTFTTQLPASGGKPPYHYSLTPGATVVPGTRVQDGPPLPTYYPSNVTGAYLGVFITPATYNTSFRVTDSTGQTYDQAVTMTVSPLALLDQGVLPHATVGTYYTYAVHPYPNDGRSYLFSASNMPAGLNIDSATGIISGIPTAATGNPNPTNAGINISDLSGNTAGWGFNLVVDPYTITTNPTLPLGTVNSPYSVTLTAPGCGTNCLWSVGGTPTTPGGNLPGFLSLPSACTNSPGTSACALTGTPNGTGNSTFTITVNGSNGEVSQAFGLQVQDYTPQPVYINTTSLGDVTVGNQTNPQLQAQGGTPPYSWALASGSLPQGVSLAGPGAAITSNANPTFWGLAGRPMVVGTYNFTLQVTDSLGATATQPLTWRVSPLNVQYNNLPVTGPCDGCGTPLTYGVAYTQPLLVMGGNGNYTGWVANPASGNPALNLPTGLTLGAGTGVVSGTPGETGSRSAPIQVTDDAGNTILQYVNFNIAGAVTLNLGPDLGTISNSFWWRDDWDLNPTGGAGPYTIAPVGVLPQGFSILTGGSVPAGSSGYVLEAFDPPPGTYTFTLKATDSLGNAGARTLTVRVTPYTLYTGTSLNDASTGTPYSQTLVSFDNSGAVTYTVAPWSALPPGLTLNGNVLQGTPTGAGDYNFTLIVTDASGLTSTVSFSLSVSSITITDPQILPRQATAGVPFTYTFTATGGGVPKTWSATGLPSGLNMSAGGTIGGTAKNTGEYQLSVTVTDGTSTFTQSFSLFVNQANPDVLSFITAYMGDISVGQTMYWGLSWTTYGGYPPYTWSIAPESTLPPGLGIVDGASAEDPLLTGLPSTAGQYAFDIIATDSHGGQVRTTFTLHVSAIGIVGDWSNFGGSLNSGVVNTPFSQQLAALGGTPPYTYTFNPSYPSPMLPQGVTASASGLISGTPTSTGSYGFQVVVRDSAGNTLTTSYSWSVSNSNGLQITNVNPSDVSVGQFQQQCLTTNGASTYIWSVVSGALPPGMTLAPGDRYCGPGTTMLTGQPTAPQPSPSSPYAFTLRATDQSNSSNWAEHLYTMRVAPMQPLYHSQYLPPAYQGVAYNFKFQVAGGTPPYTVSLAPNVPLPPGISLSVDGTLSGTPTSSGDYGLPAPAIVIRDANGFTLAYSINSGGSQESWSLQVVPQGGVAPLFTGQDTSVGEQPSMGVPYVYRADAMVQPTGTPPYTWAVASGSNLPPGITILPGGNGISSYLAGIPTTPGTYNFTLAVTDSAGQSANESVSNWPPLTTLALTPTTLPPGTVGTTYAAALAPSGGTPPYNVTLAYGSDLPPGLTISSAGLLSGTPTYPGLFQMAVTALDSAIPQNSVTESYLVTIDNASGQTPAVSISPTAVQLNFTLTGPALAPVPIVIGTTSGSYPFTAMLAGIPGATLSATSGTAPTTLYLNLATSGFNSAATYAGVIAVSAPQSANGSTAIPVVLTVSTPPPCSYSLSPQSGNMPMEGGTSSFAVSTGSLCAWTPSVSDPSWITLTAGTGPGPGTVSYSVAANPPGQAARNGSITVAGQTYSIAQAGSVCSFAVSPTSIGATSAGGTAMVSVTTSVAGCPWTASGANLSPTPTSGAGNGNVTLTIPVNNGTTAVQYTASVAGQTVTVNQAGQTPPPPVCTLSPNSGSVPATGGSGSFGVSDACGNWSATVSDATWISVNPGSGLGAATVGYTLAANPPGQPIRTGSITIAGQVFSITEFGSTCTLSINPTSVNATAAGGSATVAVTSSVAGCPWTASGLSATPSSGAGSGTVTVTIPANSAGTSQILTASIAGQTFTANESGVNCTVSLSASTAQFPAAGGSGSVNVTAPAGCSYSTLGGPSWISVGTGGSGVGAGTVNYTVAANSTTVAQSGALTIGGQPFQIAQAGVACSVTVDANASGSPFGSGGGSGAVQVTTNGPNCTWTASIGATWATVAPSLGTGSGSINLTVTGNSSSTSPRATPLTVAGQTVTIGESGTTCTYNLGSANATVPAGGGNGSVGVVAPAFCTWNSATNNPDWLSITTSGSAGNSDVQFVALANPNSTPRTGSLTVANQSYTVTQAAAPCSYALSASSATIISDGGGGTFTFTSSAGGCPATAVSYSAWLHATPSSNGSTSGTVTYAVDANPTGSTRSGTIQVGDQTFTATQAGAPCAFSLNEYGQEFDVNGTYPAFLTLLGSQSAVGCMPVVGTSQPTIVGIGTLSGPAANIYSLPFTVYQWVSPLVTGVRTANVTFGGQMFAVKQTSWAWPQQ
jgi:hypothetical protein